MKLLRLLVPVLVLIGCDVANSTATPPITPSAPANTYNSEGEIRPIQSWKLPKQLNEISGLASDSAGLVFAMGDERAHVFLLNPMSGATVSVFGLGNPVVDGDFEGIALHANRLYLVTSEGKLLRTAKQHNITAGTAEQYDGSSLDYESFALNTGCLEIEGLATAPENPWLWLACKETKPSLVGTSNEAANMEQVIRLEAWSADLEKLLPAATLELPLPEVLALTEQKKFKPSGLAFIKASSKDPGVKEAWDLLIISGAQRAYSRYRWPSTLGKAPQFKSAGRLPGRHRQAEGIDVSSNGTLLVADEGAGKRGRLRVYSGEALP